MRRATGGVSVRFSRRPRDVLQREQLRHQHAVVRGLGDREMEVAAGAGVGRRVVDDRFRLVEQARSFAMVGGGRVLGGELGGERLDRALRVHHLARADAGEVELHRERLGEQPRIAARRCARRRPRRP